MGGTILLVALLTNTVLLCLLKKEAGHWGIALRTALLFLGNVGLKSKSDWDTVRKGSVLMRILHKDRGV